MVQSGPCLDKAFVAVLGSAGFDANRCAAANTIEEFVRVADCDHAHQGEKFAVKCTSGRESCAPSAESVAATSTCDRIGKSNRRARA